VVKSKEVQDPVDQELVESRFNRYAGVLCFAGCCVEGYDHISQEVRVNLPESAILHCKRNHIGRAGPVQVCLVEPRNFQIVYNEDGQLSVRAF
jgi:hypothetical protein